MSSFRQASKLIKQFAKAQQFPATQSAQYSSKKKGPDKCLKLPSNIPPPSSQGTCKKVKAVGCDARARKDCKPIVVQRTPCEKLDPPFASYSECLKPPFPTPKMTECHMKDNGPPLECRKPKEGLSWDGCNPPMKQEVGDCRVRKRAKPKSNDCFTTKDKCNPNIKPFKNPKE